MRAKDLWFAEMERQFNELRDEMGDDAAYEQASNQAHHDLADRMADMADMARQRAKDQA